MVGVKLHPLRTISHPKGDIFHAVKKSSEDFEKFGEAYFSSINYNEIKGWKKHKKMILNFVVPIGEVQFVVFDGDLFFTTILSKNNYQRLTIAPNLWVAFKGMSEGNNLVLNIASIEHDPTESFNINVNDIEYDW